MKFGLTEEQYNYILNTAVIPMQKAGATVFCYGSRARGDHRKFSDLDLMAETPNDQSTEISRIKEELSNSNFPYLVDIVQLKDFAESYLDGYNKDKVPF